MNKQSLEVQLMAWEVVKWHAERQVKAVRAKIDRRIKQLKRDNCVGLAKEVDNVLL